ncbi:MAG: nucleoside-triphosphatase [Acidobacteriota bacterium]
MSLAGAGLAVIAVLLAFAPLPAAPLVALLAATAAALLLDPAVLRSRRNLRFLALALVFATITGALVGSSGGASKGVAKGVAVFGRTAVLVLLTALASRKIDAESLLALAAHLRLRRLGLALSLALNSLPHLGEACREAWIALAVRRFRSRPRLVDLPRLAETLLAHTARVADEAAEAAALRGHAAFSSPSLSVPAAPLLVVVTGRAQSGKTSTLRAAIETLRERGIQVAGFLQLPLIEDSSRVGFIVHDVCTGEERRLAIRAAPGAGQHGTSFHFAAAGFELAGQALSRARDGWVVVADEIGPVELRGGGHLPALRRALVRTRPLAVLLGVRRQLVSVFLGRLAPASAVVVDVGETSEPLGALLAALAPVLPSQPEPDLSSAPRERA